MKNNSICSLWTLMQWSFNFNILWQSGWLFPLIDGIEARIPRLIHPSAFPCEGSDNAVLMGAFGLRPLDKHKDVRFYCILLMGWSYIYYIWPSGSVWYGSGRWDLAVRLCIECKRNINLSWQPTASSGDTGLPAAAVSQGRRLENTN